MQWYKPKFSKCSTGQNNFTNCIQVSMSVSVWWNTRTNHRVFSEFDFATNDSFNTLWCNTGCSDGQDKDCITLVKVRITLICAGVGNTSVSHLFKCELHLSVPVGNTGCPTGNLPFCQKSRGVLTNLYCVSSIVWCARTTCAFLGQSKCVAMLLIYIVLDFEALSPIWTFCCAKFDNLLFTCIPVFLYF